FGEQEPGIDYDVEDPLFDFNVLVTGYEPFLDNAVNPAQGVAVSLNGTCDIVYLDQPRTMRLCYEGVSVPVTTEGSSWAARKLTEDPTRWDGIIHLGSPCILPTTAPVSFLDLRDLAALLEDCGHADLVSMETWSRDAGAYYCNEMFYRTLHAIRDLGAPTVDGSSLIPASTKALAMFIHLPDKEVMDLDDMALMVQFVSQNIMLGTVGLLPESCRR
ncbi:unnamed protein product, partial [Hapterophycus canaliculatus]